MRVFRLSKRRAGTVLGPLEDEIMEIVWAEAEPVSVATVHRTLGRRKKTLAYSTVKAVLTNLAGKGLLRKRSEGRSNVFSAVQTREAFRRGVVDEVIGSLVKDYRNPLLAHLVEHVARDRASLDELERLIAERRRKLTRG
ncbi:MAG TPA: BlaI/MecI/CopY family transcriptional regulator [Thermoanaerobaculia bacterium]|nr:BlaI/MecI/CopY family transcriptional regulator [Thermoanaerobaculia bacterium]